jgi:hypothetical protein
MKKMLISMLLVISVSAANAATSLNWGSDSILGSGVGPDVLDSSGNAIAQGTDWYLQLFDTTDGSWNPISNPTGGEFYSANNAFAMAPGVTLLSVPEIYPWGSAATVGTRLFNNSDPTMATQYAIASLTVTLPTLNGTATDPTVTTYNFGTIGQNDWVAVPEPATAMFGLVGIVSLVIARRRKQG